MLNIRQIRSAIDEALDRIQAKAEAAEVQANLGAMELEQRFKAQYEELVRAAADLHGRLSEAGLSEEGIKTKLRTALEELQVQAALGEADTREALDKLKGEIEKRVGQFNSAIDSVLVETDEESAKQVEAAVHQYTHQAANIEAELEARADRRDDGRD